MVPIALAGYLQRPLAQSPLRSITAFACTSCRSVGAWCATTSPRSTARKSPRGFRRTIRTTRFKCYLLPTQMSNRTDIGPARELDVALVIADLSGYTALTETHGAYHASEIVLRFERLVEASLEPGVSLVNSIGDDVFCTGADTLAVVRSALRLRDRVAREPEFPRVRTGVHRGPIIEREGKLFGAPINLTARLADHARGGQILCTNAITEAVRALAEFEPRPIGERRFKNVARPVAVFELVRISERRAVTAIDPVCRMQVEISGAGTSTSHSGTTYHFCSQACARLFAEAPERYVGP